jgi:hypothetical protein
MTMSRLTKTQKPVSEPASFDVLYRNENDDDTEILFSGNRAECVIYAKAYKDSTLTHSSFYYLNPEGAYTLQEFEYVLRFRSPLVSVDNFELWIAPSNPVA